MYSEACAFLVQAAGYAGAHVLQNEEVEKRDSRAGRHGFRVFDALCKRFGACLVGDDGPPPAARVHNNQILSRHQRQGTGRNLQGGHAVMGK